MALPTRQENKESDLARVFEPAGALGRSQRAQAVAAAGPRAVGLVHGTRTVSEAQDIGGNCERVVTLRRGKYEGFDDQHFTEKLAEVEGLELSRETVRRVLREAETLLQSS